MRLLAALAVVLLSGCGGETGQDRSASPADAADSPLRLRARPWAAAKPCAAGEYELRVAPGRRALMRVTRQPNGQPPALLVALHGAGSGGAPGGLYAFRGAWDVPGLVIVAPAAAGSAWTLGEMDVRFVDRTLQLAFARCRVDPRRVAIGGFSSGAGMALWLGTGERRPLPWRDRPLGWRLAARRAGGEAAHLRRARYAGSGHSDRPRWRRDRAPTAE